MNWTYKKFGDMTRDYTQITCLAVKHFNHYTRIFSVLVWGCNWMLFMNGWFCPICFNSSGLKSLHFENKLDRWILSRSCGFRQKSSQIIVFSSKIGIPPRNPGSATIHRSDSWLRVLTSTFSTFTGGVNERMVFRFSAPCCSTSSFLCRNCSLGNAPTTLLCVL